MGTVNDKYVYLTLPCSNCEHTGKVTIYNAYDPEYEKEVTCSVCNGTGLISKKHLLHKIKQKN